MSHPLPHILFICSWYPSRENIHLGNFVRRHAKAAAIHHEVTVIAAVESSTPEISIRTADGVREVIVYYGKKLPFWSYYAALKKAYRTALAPGKNFDRIHVHVTYPAGYLALRLRQPYFITEHFTGYLPISRFQWNTWQKWIAKKILQQATLVLPVSNNLGKGLEQFAPGTRWKKLSNVVDSTHFYPASQLPSTFTYLHISTLNEETKNISGLLSAFKILDEQGLCFRLCIGGDGDLSLLEERIRVSGITPGKVETFGAQPEPDIARLMRQAHVFTLASHAENQPCVILEALCCGVPVVSTDVGGIREEVHADNGLLVPADQPAALATALKEIYENYGRYDRQAIADKARQEYSYQSVASRLRKLYAG